VGFLFKRKKEEITEQPPRDFGSFIEFSLLDPRAIEADVHTLVNIAIKNGYYGVCVNPVNVYYAYSYISERAKRDIKVIATVGFPLGASKTEVKVLEAREAFADGASELDVVINIARAKEGDFGYIKNELSRIVRIARGRVVKAIIETSYLNREQTKGVLKACIKAKIDFIQTSTGYGEGGATPEDVDFIKSIVGEKCYVKAAGAVKTRAQVEELIRSGAERIGTSRAL